jgi:hypothetical protein
MLYPGKSNESQLEKKFQCSTSGSTLENRQLSSNGYKKGYFAEYRSSAQLVTFLMRIQDKNRRTTAEAQELMKKSENMVYKTPSGNLSLELEFENVYEVRRKYFGCL